MDHQENLFATPARPKILRISVERAWSVGDDVWDLSMAAHGTKGQGPAWADGLRYEGEDAVPGLALTIEAALFRFGASRWSTKPRMATLDQWRASGRL